MHLSSPAALFTYPEMVQPRSERLLLYHYTLFAQTRVFDLQLNIYCVLSCILLHYLRYSWSLALQPVRSLPDIQIYQLHT